jgi:hypothetical protein
VGNVLITGYAGVALIYCAVKLPFHIGATTGGGMKNCLAGREQDRGGSADNRLCRRGADLTL